MDFKKLKHIQINIQVTSKRIAVAVTFPGLRFQHPTTPVQKAMNTVKNATMNSATVDRAMCNLKSYIKYIYNIKFISMTNTV